MIFYNKPEAIEPFDVNIDVAETLYVLFKEKLIHDVERALRLFDHSIWTCFNKFSPAEINEAYQEARAGVLEVMTFEGVVGAEPEAPPPPEGDATSGRGGHTPIEPGQPLPTPPPKPPKPGHDLPPIGEWPNQDLPKPPAHGDNTLPTPPSQIDNTLPGTPVRPGNALPGGPVYPGHALPKPPNRPGHELPTPPNEIDNTLPEDRPGADNELPGPSGGRPSHGLPPTASPKKKH